MAAAPADDRKRVKVYELKNNDWYDRGTGFCVGEIIGGPDANPDFPDARIIVHSEDDPNRKLLETRITKDDGYQQQQQTLIVWTESNGVDMALSFQEAEGCTHIWQFVSEVQTKLSALAPDGGLSDDDMLDTLVPAVQLPTPRLGHLEDVLATIRNLSSTPHGREALVKMVMGSEQPYILKLAPLVEEAEDLESTNDLHQLCTIMKHLILLNDNAIIEYVVTDEAIMGVLGALEYDPDFPSHRAAHRHFLRETSKFKEIVPFRDIEIRNKIQYTHRLLYLKDVVLARILDDPTFSVLNSLIFFHHVDIIQYVTSDPEHCERLFAIINDEQEDPEKRKTALVFIQNCCAVAKNIQPVNRAGLYNALVNHGLFSVIGYALRHEDTSVRVAGTDVLVALIDHDPSVVRAQIDGGRRVKGGPIIDILIDLLLVETDLGVKSQIADAIKILLDPTATNAAMEMIHRQNTDMKQRGSNNISAFQISQHTEHHRLMKLFIARFYEFNARRLFQPFRDLENRTDMSRLTVQELSLYTHLIEMLCFFVRYHPYEIKPIIRSDDLHIRIAQLLRCRQKYIRLVALKWFRTCISLADEFHNLEIIRAELFEPILDIVYETMPRDNLLNSACLEFFEFLNKDTLKILLEHVVTSYRERLLNIHYVPTFRALVLRWDQMSDRDFVPDGAENSFTTEPDTPPPNSQRVHASNERQTFGGLREDMDEDAYFNGEDGFDADIVDEDELALPTAPATRTAQPNGRSNSKAPLVDYPDDDDEDILASPPELQKDKHSNDTPSSEKSSQMEPMETTALDERRGRRRSASQRGSSPREAHRSPQESLTPIKRRREDDEDEEDELSKMMAGAKRRNSGASTMSTRKNQQAEAAAAERSAPNLDLEGGVDGNKPASPPTDSPNQESSSTVPSHGHVLRRKGSLKVRNETTVPGASSTTATTNHANGRGSVKGSNRAHPDSRKSAEEKKSSAGGGGGGG